MSDDFGPARGWRAGALRDVARVGSGSVAPSSPGPIPVMGANGPIGTTSRSNLSQGVIVGRVGAAGSVTPVEQPCWASDNTLTVVPRRGALDPSYLQHLVSSLRPERLATHTAQPLITQSALAAVGIRYPDEGREQRLIAEVLDTVDEAIRSTERMRAKARSAHRALAAVLLNADAPFVALGRLVSDVTSGGTPTSGDPRYYADHGTPFAKIDDLTRAEGRLLTSTQQHLTDAGLRESSARIYPAGTILVSMYGTIGLSKTLASAMAGNQALAALMPPFGCDGDYLALQLEHSRSSLERLATQTTQPNISGRSVRAFKVRVPPLEAQRQIVAVMDSAEWHVATLARRIVQLQQLRAGLADDLLTGRVRTVPV